MSDSYPVLDTHTGGEITRIVFAHDIGLGREPVEQQLLKLKTQLDWIRSSLTSEPRGSEYAVGAVVTPPEADSSQGSVVFFNNVGYLGMCGHGLIGVVEALRYRGLIEARTYQFDTPAGNVAATLHPDRRVSFTGVPSFCYRQEVALTCAAGETVVGEIAYGGNWFFLTPHADIQAAKIGELMDRSQQIRDALDDQAIRGADGAVIDHVELYCPLPDSTGPHSGREGETDATPGSRNFVLCPGGHYDRSPCGTGTSAKLACLATRGELEPGSPWIQESVTGSRFIASYQREGEQLRVNISGRAHVLAETVQVYDADDSLRFGTGGHEQ